MSQDNSETRQQMDLEDFNDEKSYISLDSFEKQIIRYGDLPDDDAPDRNTGGGSADDSSANSANSANSSESLADLKTKSWQIWGKTFEGTEKEANKIVGKYYDRLCAVGMDVQFFDEMTAAENSSSPTTHSMVAQLAGNNDSNGNRNKDQDGSKEDKKLPGRNQGEDEAEAEPPLVQFLRTLRLQSDNWLLAMERTGEMTAGEIAQARVILDSTQEHAASLLDGDHRVTGSSAQKGDTLVGFLQDIHEKSKQLLQSDHRLTGTVPAVAAAAATATATATATLQNRGSSKREASTDDTFPFAHSKNGIKKRKTGKTRKNDGIITMGGDEFSNYFKEAGDAGEYDYKRQPDKKKKKKEKTHKSKK